MPGKKGGGKKKVAPLPKVAGKAGKSDSGKKASKKTLKHPLLVSKPKRFGIGGDLRPGRDVTHFVKWPKYVRLQRQKQVLLDRLKVPPVIQQFRESLDKNSTVELFRLLNKYRPETKAQKQQRLLKAAKAAKDGKAAPKGDAPNVVKYGLNHVTALVENNKARLVVIAHDVDPLELVVWLPRLCQKKNVPYVIVKSKARLGQVVHKKTSAVLAITSVAPGDTQQLDRLISSARDQFNGRSDQIRRNWGGLQRGLKSRARDAQKQAIIDAEIEASKALGAGL